MLFSLRPILCLAVILVAAYRIYSAAFSAEFNFDDLSNLEPLKDVSDFGSALRFLFSSDTGPLGRPIAMATFALEFSAWPHDPSEFLYANTLIHLINGLLVAWFGLRLSRFLPVIRAHGEGFAVTLCALWVLQPILASASLLVIQRMATLSSTFMLAGLVGYLIGRERVACQRPKGWLILLLSLGLGTLLAIFTKETGALLAIYVGVLEITLLEGSLQTPAFRIWRRLLVLPVIVLALYAAQQLPYFFEETQRGFSAYQRLLTESRILWTYLRLILLPRAADLGPYHDDYGLSESPWVPPTTIWAILAWLTVIGAAVALRKRLPWFAFATAWFLMGHSLESSLFNLELYFEHRNYLASLGPLALVAYLVWTVPPTYQKVAFFALAIYILLLGFVLHELTLTWGQPFMAVQLWADKHPYSERAQQFLAQRSSRLGEQEQVQIIMDRAFANMPLNAGLALQTVQIACYRHQDISAKLERIMPLMATGPFSYSTLDALQKLVNMKAENSCPGLTTESLHGLIDVLLGNPHFGMSPIGLYELHRHKALMYFEARELSPAVEHLEQAFAQKHNLDTAVMIVGFLASAGLYDVAQQKLEEFEQAAPANPYMKSQWLARLQEVRAALDSDRKKARH